VGKVDVINVFDAFVAIWRWEYDTLQGVSGGDRSGLEIFGSVEGGF
jgi:hypothetical protein